MQWCVCERHSPTAMAFPVGSTGWPCAAPASSISSLTGYKQTRRSPSTPPANLVGNTRLMGVCRVFSHLRIQLGLHLRLVVLHLLRVKGRSAFLRRCAHIQAVPAVWDTTSLSRPSILALKPLLRKSLQSDRRCRFRASNCLQTATDTSRGATQWQRPRRARLCRRC